MVNVGLFLTTMTTAHGAPAPASTELAFERVGDDDRIARRQIFCYGRPELQYTSAGVSFSFVSSKTFRYHCKKYRFDIIWLRVEIPEVVQSSDVTTLESDHFCNKG